MALILPVSFGNTGVNATYWRIVDKYENRDSSIIRVQVEGWLDKETRLTESATPLPMNKQITLAEELYTPDMSFADLYTALKSTVDFAGATDDI